MANRRDIALRAVQAADGAICTELGLIFAGPDTDAIAMIGDKFTPRRTAQKFGIALVPSHETACCAARGIERHWLS